MSSFFCTPRPCCLLYRFGVKQREKLSRGSSLSPHMLLMTATPIPRTMALVQYGAMRQSRITDMPPGRQPIGTRVVQDTEEARKQVQLAEQCATVLQLLAMAGDGLAA